MIVIQTGTTMREMNGVAQLISSAVQASGVDDTISKQLTETLQKELNDYISLESLKNKLEVLYSFEKNYLELIKSYKEEIKFASTLQEDLRKERSKFFSETLKEVSQTLSESQVDGSVASKWLKELVESYTKSLDLSSSLIEENTLDTIGKIRSEAKLHKPALSSGD
ncbi:TPA: nickel transporter [Enterobacter roggenkampii]|nr:nickel transporter [Enterobacter roggenkampii]EJO48225.1 histidin kinase-like protein [Enterobacter sp. SST3]EKU9555422.1 nickel transporter [Enterobacter roggenkampii MGH 34]KLG14486.1 nickel transporter [Enterobacter kobei]EMF0891152.1 nickel transporter [Enterobacter roggenkampii]